MTTPGGKHEPMRPLWLCKRCGHPWPCAAARLALVAEHGEDPLSISVYLYAQLYAAAIDLHRLNPDAAPGPQALFARFVGWASRRRSPSGT